MTFQPWIDILMLALIPAGLGGFLWAIRHVSRQMEQREEEDNEW